MLVLMDSTANIGQIQAVQAVFKEVGIRNLFQKNHKIIITLTAVCDNADFFAAISMMPGVSQVLPVRSPFRLASANFARQQTTIDVNGVQVGGKKLTIIAGPCGVESREQLFTIARYVAKSGIKLLRAGAFKPRTSPYAFQGIGAQALKFLLEARTEFGLGIVTEATEVELFDEIELVADIVQIGARNMQNFALLKRAGRSYRPVLLKRGPSANLEEWLFAAEYILSEGNQNVILCERGIRTWSSHARNTFDVSIIPAVKKLTHLPIIVDPSHAVGRKDLVIPCARAAVAAGSDGLLIETHYEPTKALSDGPQALLPDDLTQLIEQTHIIYDVLLK